MARERIYFYHQFITLIVMHVRLFSRILDKHFGLTLSEFCILCFLEDSERKTSVNDIRQLLSLQTESTRVILLALEDKGLVLKQDDESDKRRMLCWLAPAAQPIISDAQRVIIDYLEQTFWKNLPYDELSWKGQRLYLSERKQPQYDDQCKVHAIPADQSELSAPARPWLMVLILNVTTLLAQWKRYTRHKAGISFSAYRILALLEKSEGVASANIAAKLFLPTSRIAVGKNELIKKGLVRERVSKSDSRIKLLTCTKQGLHTLKELNEGMQELTECFYGPLSDDKIRMLNAWHMRMCCEVEFADRAIQALV